MALYKIQVLPAFILMMVSYHTRVGQIKIGGFLDTSKDASLECPLLDEHLDKTR